jgi:hypothetical protein
MSHSSIESEDYHRYHSDNNDHRHPSSPINNGKNTNMVFLATPVRISRMMSSHYGIHKGDDDSMVDDAMQTAIFNENSCKIDHEHQKGKYSAQAMKLMFLLWGL